MKDFYNLQEEQRIWSQKNFGANEKHRPLLGIIEELGELSEAIEALDRKKVLDSVGDIVIYMADLSTQWGWNLNLLLESGLQRYSVYQETYSFSKLQGRLAHHHLKWEQKIRKSENHEQCLTDLMRQILAKIDGYCTYLGAELTEEVARVWKEVSQRNWRANPDSAHEVVDGQGG